MFDPKSVRTAHCIGIGGIHVSAVARLLQSRGIRVTGSDAVDGEEVRRLKDEGIAVTIGHVAANIPSEIDVVIYSDAVPEDNPERTEVVRRNIQSFDTHSFLGLIFSDARQVVITGTHGKSTTTAMVGKILEAAGMNPTVVVGTRVPGFPKGNLRIGRDDLLVVEGDEFRSHVLSYKPTVLAITNIEWDHPDVFPTFESYKNLFDQAVAKTKSGGTVIDASSGRDAAQLRPPSGLTLLIPGDMNRQNAALAFAACRALNPSLDVDLAIKTLNAFPGVWRRFERVGEFNGAPIISDYGHHPTEIRETLKAAREAYPDRRLVLCYQPHQHARTKGLFDEFATVLSEPDFLLLAEIYDVPGREEVAQDVTSKQLLEAIHGSRPREYASDIADAEQKLRALIQPNDLVLIMGAGTIDGVARHLIKNI